MNDIKNKIKELISRDQRYSAFRDNDFVDNKADILEFKDSKCESIGFYWNGVLTYAEHLKRKKRQEYDSSKQKENTFNALCSIFDIQRTESFRQSFDEAISGDGKELLNMLTLWSSSLCPLLSFFNVNNYPITITITGDEYKFDEVHFEIKNKVYGHPSNMDIVLIAKEPKPAILFLESKFSEYLDNKEEKISEKYLREPAFKDTLNWIERNVPKKEDVYIEGLKQFLAHYIGLSHFVNDEDYPYHQDEKSKHSVYEFYSKNKEDTKIFLQEIVFNLDDKKCSAYKRHLSIMIEKIKINMNEPKITILSPITYQDFFGPENVHKVLCETVRDFYKL